MIQWDQYEIYRSTKEFQVLHAKFYCGLWWCVTILPSGGTCAVSTIWQWCRSCQRVLSRRVVIVAALILTGDGSFFRCALSVTLVVTLRQVCLLMHRAGEDLFPVWPLTVGLVQKIRILTRGSGKCQRLCDPVRLIWDLQKHKRVSSSPCKVLLWPLVVCYYSSFGRYLCSEYNTTVMQIVSKSAVEESSYHIVAALILTGDGSFFRCALSVTLVVTLQQVCLLMRWAGEDLFPVWPL